MPSAYGRQSSSTLRRRQLGTELRRLREAAGLTIDQVSAELYCSSSKVSRVEKGRVGATLRDVRDMLDLYGVTGEQKVALFQLAREARQKEDWWHAVGDVPDARTFIGFERAAESVRIYDSLLIPGLLQIEEYARLIISAIYSNLRPHEVERYVELRMVRQAILNGDDPPTLRAVVDEAALRRLVGKRPVMRKQLHHLVEAASLANVIFQVIPYTGGEHGGMVGSFTILGFPDSADSEVIHIEHATGDLYLDRPDQVHRYRQMFEHLRGVALNPDDSMAFVANLAQELEL